MAVMIWEAMSGNGAVIGMMTDIILQVHIVILLVRRLVSLVCCAVAVGSPDRPPAARRIGAGTILRIGARTSGFVRRLPHNFLNIC